MKEFDLPKRVICGARKYRVKYPYSFSERAELCGQADHPVGDIRVAQFDQSGCVRADEDVLNTFFHELVHCIDMVYCQNTLGKEREPEELVDGIAEGLTQLFLNGSLPTKKSK